jgi:SAM-dependent methyltransferase
LAILALGATSHGAVAGRSAKLDRLLAQLYSLDAHDQSSVRRRIALKRQIREAAPVAKRRADRVDASIGRDYPEDERSILVKRRSGGKWRRRGYARTDRDVDEYPSVVDLRALRGKRLLDLGAGDGRYVMKARRSGVLADGVDVVLSPQEKRRPYFFEADAVNTGLPGRRYDEIVSVASLFSYEANNRALMRSALAEAHRLLKMGGYLTLDDGYPAGMIARLRGFEVVAGGHAGTIRLRKTRATFSVARTRGRT